MTPHSSMQLSPFYWDLRNRITRPWDSVGQLVSKYFWKRWMPVLGPEYTILIIELRQLAAASSLARGTPSFASNAPTVQVSHQDLADRTGFSLRKIQRLLTPSAMRKPENWFVGRFLRVENCYVYDEARKKKVRVANSYAIAIDDPLHPEDEEEINIEFTRREREDLRAQGFEATLPQPEPAESLLPSTLPPVSAEEERVYQLAKELVPDLSLTVLARLIATVGHPAVLRQLEWFPLRDNTWAKNGPAAAFFTYCKEDRPEPPAAARVTRETHNEALSLQTAREATREALQSAPDPASQPEVWHQILEKMPKVTRFGLGRRVEFLGFDDGRVVCRCPTAGDALLLRHNQRIWDSAASEVLGVPAVVVFESESDQETSCAR